MSEYSFSYDGYRKFVANQARIARWAEETARAVGGEYGVRPVHQGDNSSTTEDSSTADTSSSTTLDDMRGSPETRTRQHTHTRIRGGSLLPPSGLARSRSTAATHQPPRPTAASRRSSSMMGGEMGYGACRATYGSHAIRGQFRLLFERTQRPTSPPQESRLGMKA
ncbi:uncharacterized protein SCHCODRAFT_02123287 [Schizophyllum commune H4-8]|uniref:uncharacterized protein n=1 Tax=Schizophyllum commune (strain H4-8 / FGSC 9210) TaxID=578458 RepID=UPI00215FD967|nr:uncharacterized protein SCHCODRAFT_02123287 [Schizophyllum commune H4-8]KAI5885248.1 hypothetical protein SCHCODRAFT_02123287 [Schizophyllum commune H4-8]